MAASRKSRRNKSRRSRKSRGGRIKRTRKTMGSKSLRNLAPPLSDISSYKNPSTIASNMSLTELQNAAAARGIPFGGLNKEALLLRINKYA